MTPSQIMALEAKCQQADWERSVIASASTDTSDAPPPNDDADDDHGEPPLVCPVTGSICLTEQDEFCEDYGCARKAGIDVDRDLIY